MYLSAGVVDDGLWDEELKPGAAFGAAVVAWLLGMVAAIAVLALWGRAARHQDGAFKQCCSKSNASGANTVGTV